MLCLFLHGDVATLTSVSGCNAAAVAGTCKRAGFSCGLAGHGANLIVYRPCCRGRVGAGRIHGGEARDGGRAVNLAQQRSQQPSEKPEAGVQESGMDEARSHMHAPSAQCRIECTGRIMHARAAAHKACSAHRGNLSAALQRAAACSRLRERHLEQAGRRAGLARVAGVEHDCQQAGRLAGAPAREHHRARPRRQRARGARGA
jgi:hypothetical protein